MALSSDQGGCCFSSFVICSGCAWPIPPVLLVKGMLTDFVGGSLAEPGHARSEEPGKPEQRRQVLDHAKHMPGLRLRTEILDAEGGQSLAKALPLSSSGALRTELGFPFATARLQWWWKGF